MIAYPLLMSLGALLIFVGIFLLVAGLYQGIPFIGDTLQDRQKDVITREERQRIRIYGQLGLISLALGLSCQLVASWVEWFGS